MKIEDFTKGREFQVVEHINYRDEFQGVFQVPKGIRVIVDGSSDGVIYFHEKNSGMPFSVLAFCHENMLDSFFPMS